VLRKSPSSLELPHLFCLEELTKTKYTLPGHPVSGFESGTVQIMAANHATATVCYYIIIIMVVVIVITELFLNGLDAMKIHTKAVSANYRTPSKSGHTLIL